MFSKIKSPDGYLSNISRCVKDNGKKISSMKSHDHHVFLEQLLPLATRGFLPKQVYEPLVRKMHENGCVDNDLYNLVCGPSRVVKRYTGYIVNGYRFHTSDRSENRKTQNCGVMLHYPGGNRAQPRYFYDMPSDDGDQQALDTNAYQQAEVEAIVEEQSSDPLNINFSLKSLATNDFVVEREAKTVEFVKQLLEEMTIDDEFINDGDIQDI
ncbi:hypothetical protein V2J09_006278 [Rumex salicifolius]